MKRYYIVFKGQVQGVGFRYTAERIAYKYHLTGWVRNRYDESVEMEVQGDAASITKMIGDLMNASRWIIIEDYSIREIPLKDERRFTIDY